MAQQGKSGRYKKDRKIFAEQPEAECRTRRIPQVFFVMLQNPVQEIYGQHPEQTARNIGYHLQSADSKYRHNAENQDGIQTDPGAVEEHDSHGIDCERGSGKKKAASDPDPEDGVAADGGKESHNIGDSRRVIIITEIKMLRPVPVIRFCVAQPGQSTDQGPKDCQRQNKRKAVSTVFLFQTHTFASANCNRTEVFFPR